MSLFIPTRYCTSCKNHLIVSDILCKEIAKCSPAIDKIYLSKEIQSHLQITESCCANCGLSDDECMDNSFQSSFESNESSDHGVIFVKDDDDNKKLSNVSDDIKSPSEHCENTVVVSNLPVDRESEEFYNSAWKRNEITFPGCVLSDDENDIELNNDGDDGDDVNDGDDGDCENMERTVVVSNLPVDLTDEEFYNLFVSKKLSPVYANMFLNSKLSRGIGIAFFSSKYEQKKALRVLQNCEVDGKKILVEIK